MLTLLFRLAVGLVLIIAPFVLLAIASGKPEGMMYLIFPFFGAVPALLFALIIFAPLEALLDRLGRPRLKTPLVALTGAALIFAFALILWSLSGNLDDQLARIPERGGQLAGPFLVWSVMGVIWGLFWRLTDVLAAKLKRRFGKARA